ncbi:radical SAM protein [Mesorhizobium silamurunense]|uniref:radical SAM protein n=1 Tax=Mesorhizobium silamurunense TaxID=499528 RepID=UPI001FE5E335|nr:radical SAM protein [Mesorhizobium silamurunense]
MKLAAWHRARGDEIHFYTGDRGAERHLGEPAYDHVYGSAIFSFSAPLVEKFRAQWPGAVVGGTWDKSPITVEDVTGGAYEHYDYSIAPKKFHASIGYTQRGCRLNCGFCVVPWKEGKPVAVNTVARIWRGPGFPKHIHLIDNDFFGQPRADWEARIAEIRDGEFKVCFNQGINVRALTKNAAVALASVQYRDDGFRERRLYTAWDNIGDERVFFRGVDFLESAGVPAKHLMAYVLIGFDPGETWERLLYRFRRMVARGIQPYPMVFGDKRRSLPLGGCNQRLEQRNLGEFQRWTVTGLYRAVEFEDYDRSSNRMNKGAPDLFEVPA